MGYEILMIVGKTGHSSPELTLSTKRYDDDSGFEYLKDADGNNIPTGRNQTYFSAMAQIDLCKLGYQEDALNTLISESFEKGKSDTKNVYYFYRGNEETKEDCYGAKMYPVPVPDVLKALRASHPAGSYRRTDWAIALLAAMESDSEKLEVLFYGH